MKKAVLHKLCENAVVHAGGTTNLKNHSLFGIFGEFNKLYKKTELKLDTDGSM